MQPNEQKSALTFFILVFAISIPFWILDVVYPVEMLPGLPLSALGAFAPAIAALLLVFRQGGFPRAGQLLRRSFDYNRIHNKLWLLVAFLINPLVAISAYQRMQAAGLSLPGFPPLSLAVVPMFLFFFIGALGEEIGWTGYATEPLRRHSGILKASLILGLVGSVWHYVPLLQAHRSAEWIAWWTLNTVSLRLIMGWLYNHTEGSVFAAALFHTMINLCWQLFPVSGSFYDPRVFALIELAFALAILILDRLLGNRKLSFETT